MTTTTTTTTATTFGWLQATLVADYKLAPETLTLDAPLDGLGIDSLGVAELLFAVEDQFGITLPPEPVQLPTLGDVVRFIDRLVAEQHGTAQPGAEAHAGAQAQPPTPAA